MKKKFYIFDPKWKLTLPNGKKQDIVFGRDGFGHVPGGAQLGKTAIFTQVIHSDEDCVMETTMGADWFWKAELNGQVIADFTRGNGGGTDYDNHIIDLPLKKGNNTLVVSVESGSGGFSLACACFKPNSNPVDYAVAPDPTTVTGKMKMLNGGNQASVLFDEHFYPNFRKEYQEMRIPLVRLHDAPLNNPGMRLVDTHLIFGTPTADVNDPNSYYFEQTDDYIRNTMALGTKIYYRLGCSIEHSLNKYSTNPKMATEKWIEVCKHIIRHYNEGWANGYKLGIEYWEIWNEAIENGKGNPRQWFGTTEQFYEFYTQVSIALKKEFPHLKIGGPADICATDVIEFAKYCGKHKAVIDFYSYHTYGSKLDAFNKAAMVREHLDKNGYKNAEIHLNEWHPTMPPERSKDPMDVEYGYDISKSYKGIHAASFAVNCMIGWQNTVLDKAFYYTVTNSSTWGVFNGDNRIKTKCYYALKLYGEVYALTPNMVPVAGAPTDFLEKAKVLAGVSDDKKDFRMIITSHKQTSTIKLDLSKLKDYDLTLVTLDSKNDELEKPLDKAKLTLKTNNSAVWLIRGTHK